MPKHRSDTEAQARACRKMARRFEKFFREFHALAEKHRMEAALTCVTSVDAESGEVHMSSDASTARFEDSREAGEEAVGDLREAMQVALDDLMMSLELKWASLEELYENERERAREEARQEYEPERPPARLPPPSMDPLARLRAMGLPIDQPVPLTLVTAPLSRAHTPYVFQQLVLHSKYRIPN